MNDIPKDAIDRMTFNKWTFTSPCAHAPTLALGHWRKGWGVPEAQDGNSHRALKMHQK